MKSLSLTVAPKDVEEGDVIIAVDGEPVTHMRVLRRTRHHQTASFDCRAHFTGRSTNLRVSAQQTITIVREEP